MSHMLDTMTSHGCGGEILFNGGKDEQAHVYCTKCGAFNHDSDDSFPTGTDEAANQAAWDAGEDRSPDGESMRGESMRTFILIDNDAYSCDTVAEIDAAEEAMSAAGIDELPVYVGDPGGESYKNGSIVFAARSAAALEEVTCAAATWSAAPDDQSPETDAAHRGLVEAIEAAVRIALVSDRRIRAAVKAGLDSDEVDVSAAMESLFPSDATE